MTGKKQYLSTVPVLLFFLGGGFLLNARLLNNGFLSDDYDSLYRLLIQKRVIYREFLRPMIDISFYLNYCISGLSAGSYYFFNIAVHGLNAWLLFRLAGRMNIVKPADKTWFSFAGALLFLVYPFHQESVAWLSGRLSSLACLFALLALLYETGADRRERTPIAVSCYLLGLLCYESILLLPFIVLVLKWRERSTRPLKTGEIITWFLALAVYLAARVLLTGELTGAYGSRITDGGLLQDLIAGTKVFARLFLPPSENQLLLVGLGAVLMVILGMLGRQVVKRRRQFQGFTGFVRLGVCLLISLLLAMVFGVSTHTTEGDRLLYFPACFLCLVLAWLIVSLIRGLVARQVAILVLVTVSVLLLEMSNNHWEKASGAAAAIMQAAGKAGSGNVILINLPDEIDGAYVFRNGFTRALVVRGTDTGRVAVVNHLAWAERLRAGPIIRPVQEGDSVFIYPVTSIARQPGGWLIRNQQNSNNFTARSRTDRIYYWNGLLLAPLEVPGQAAGD